MSGFMSEAPTYKVGYKFTRAVGYVLFIASVSGYAAQYLWTTLLEASPYDNQLYIYVVALAICWIGSVLLMWKWFRFYQYYWPGPWSFAVALLPLMILPLAWGCLQLIKLVETNF